ncbi:MAG TPA: phosphatase PAP2 family protein [Actinomycetota bacterium]|nr:phosphatase PAP2 family protein [Actinomycetota bacterium]
MDVPADRSTRAAGPPAPTAMRPAARSRRRRPTGEPPPLPHHLQTSGVGWLVATVVLLALAVVVFGRGLRGLAVDLAAFDSAVVGWLAGIDLPGFRAVMRGLAALSSWWVLNVVAFALILVLLVLRRFRHLILWVVLTNLVSFIGGTVIGPVTQRPRPFGVVVREGWGGWAMPSLHVTFFALGLVAILYTLVPEGRWRNTGKWVVVALVALTALGRMALGADGPIDVLVGVALGVTIPLLLYRWFTPSEVFPISYRRGRGAHLDVGGARGAAIRRALEDQLGLVVTEVKPFGLSGSAGSTPLRITVEGDPPQQLFGKLYAQSHLRSDRWYKLGRELLYGRLEDEKPFNTVRRLVQQEDYALSLMQRAGLPSPAPFGFVELTPEREYLLVTEFFAGATELGEAEVDEGVIDDGLRVVRRLWDAGLAHRDIKPANLLVRDGRMLLIDLAFIEARPSPWRQAVDLANMMLCLALRTDPERVYQRALRQFSVQEITEGFAAARGLALPSQLRHLLQTQGRDLHAQFVRLLPSPPRPIRIQRWSVRRVGLLAGMVLLVVLLVDQWAFSLDFGQEAVATPTSVGGLACADLQPQWLMAQSVPSSSLVPCLRSLPTGWTVGLVTVNNGRSVILLDHDRAGAGVVTLRLTAACAPQGATEVTADQPQIRRYQRIDRLAPRFEATRFDLFPGGCVTAQTAVPAANRAEVTGELSAMLDYTTRQTLQRALDQRSGGRLRLDPPGSRGRRQ